MISERPRGPARDEGALDDLHALVNAHREEILQRAESWVADQSPDLREPARRSDTRRLVERLVGAYERALFEDDRSALDEFVAYVTTFRASSAFHVSTVLRGLLSFRAGLQGVLFRERDGDPNVAHMLAAVDEVSFEAVFAGADEYAAKLRDAVDARRREVERDLRDDAARRRRVLEATAGALQLVRVGDAVGLVVVPEGLDEARTALLLQRLLEASAADRPAELVVDLGRAGEPTALLATLVAQLLEATVVSGGRCVLAGLEEPRASVLAELDPALGSLPTYETLEDALVDAIGRTSGTVRGGGGPRP